VLEENGRQGRIALLLLEDAEAVEDVAVLRRHLVSLIVEAVVLHVELCVRRVSEPSSQRHDECAHAHAHAHATSGEGGSGSPVSKLCFTGSAALGTDSCSSGRINRCRAASGRHHRPCTYSTYSCALR
jgi:hypothetical protein